MTDSLPDTAALPVCWRCQRKIITFDGSRPTICGNCQHATAALDTEEVRHGLL